MTVAAPRQEQGATRSLVAWLRTPEAIRARSGELCRRATAGASDAFHVRREKLETVVAAVSKTIESSPLDHPHGRMGHFDAGGVSRSTELEAHLSKLLADERARSKIDLLVTSVLLDAGAGAAWTYVDDGCRLTRSEGLAVASLRLFLSGALSSEGEGPRCDASGLARVTTASLGAALQVTPTNPLVGLGGRAHLLRALGAACQARPDLFGSEARPGNLLDWTRARAEQGAIRARLLLGAILEGLSPIWPGRVELGGQNLGDVWAHPSLGRGADALVPFHKLSQWLTHSLVEPLAEAGIRVTELEALTVLPEYRSGGLLIDAGVLELVDPDAARRTHGAGDPLVVEWRALTVALFDEIAESLRAVARERSRSAAGLVELAIWKTGRSFAHAARPSGAPPLSVESDGTVF